MSNALSAQHPAVILRSTYRHLRTLLAIAAIAVVGLTVAVVVLAIGSGGSATASPATRVFSTARANSSAETGAKLNHSGRLHFSSPQPGRTTNYAGHF